MDNLPPGRQKRWFRISRPLEDVKVNALFFIRRF